MKLGGALPHRGRAGPTLLLAVCGLGAVIGLLLAYRPPELTDSPVQTTRYAPPGPDQTTVPSRTTGGSPDLALFIGSATELLRIDLETGESTAFESVGWPVHAAEGWLVLIHPNGHSVRAVPLDDVDAAGQLLGSTAEAGGGFGPGPEPGQIWLPTPEGATMWHFIDVDDGGGARQDESPDLGVGMMSGSAVVTSSRAGGVFVVDQGEYRRVFNGEPVALSLDYLLARRCLSPTDCELQWLERGSWAEVDRAVPDTDLACGGWLSADGAWLAFLDLGEAVPSDLATGTVRVFNVETQDYVDILPTSEPSAPPVVGQCNVNSAADRFGRHDGAPEPPIDTGPFDYQLLFVDQR